GFGAHQAAAPVEALAGEDPGLVPVGEALVLAEKVADLAAADTDIPGGHVGVLTEVAVQLRHQALAETHDLAVRLTLGVKVAAALAAADGHAGERVLENLFETQELDDAQVNRRVKAHTALVGAESTVELDAKAPVDMDLALVVLPGDAKDDLSFGFTNALDNLLVGKFGVLHQYGAQGFQDFVDRLVKFAFPRVSVQDFLENRLQFFIELCGHHRVSLA